MKSKTLKITCIIHSLKIGGMERVMSILINDFAKRENVEVSLVLIGKQRAVDFDLDHRIKVIKPSFEFDNKNRNIFTLKTILFIRKTIKYIKPNIILSFGEIWNNLVLLSLRGLNVPIYISDRSQPNKNLGSLHNFLKKKLYPKAAGYIVQTEHAEKIAKAKKWNKNIKVIGNPIRPLDLPEIIKENIILTVGRLIPTKNVDRLMHVFSKINNDSWQLNIIGGNAKNLDLLSQYKRQAKTLGHTKQIKLLGQKKNVEDYLAKSKIFAFMSTSEGFPNALGEAMSAGCACIAYDCTAGPSDIIDNGINGYLIPENDEIEFERKLKLLMGNHEIREAFGEKAKEKMNKFRVENIAETFFSFLNNKLQTA